MKFSETYISFILLGLMVVGAMSFVVELQTENNVTTITEDEQFGAIINSTFIELPTKLNDGQELTNKSLEAFQKEIPEPSFGSLIIFAIVGVVTGFQGLLSGIYNIIIVIPSNILQIPPVVTGALATLLGTMFVLMAWRVYRAGE